MHPALLPILALTYVPLAWRRTPWTRALAVVGTAVTLFLLPVLRHPGTIPSPSANLAKVVPWQSVADPAAGNPHLVDVTHQIEPWLLFLRHELREGRLPFWNPFQFAGEPFWSNGQSAPLFPLHLLFTALPVLLGFTLLPWLRLVAGGMGAWALARELGASERAAWMAGVVYPLSGMIVSWALYPMGNAHPFVPWVFWALERFLRGASSWRLLGAMAALQLLAGHPETPVFTAFLGGVYLLARGRSVVLSARTWLGYAGAWITGLAISAIQIVPLAFTIFVSSKWHEHALPTPVPIGTKLALLSRFLLPDLFGRAGEGTWWGPFNDPATSVYAGALVLPLAALGAVRMRRDPRWRALAVMGVFALAASYHLFGTGWLLVRLPVLGLGLHHYMKFGVELALALFAAAGLDRIVRERVLRLPWLVAAGIGGWAGCLWWIFREDWSRVGLSANAAAGLSWAFSAALFVALLARFGSSTAIAKVAVPALVAITALDLSIAHRGTAPALPVERLYPRTPAVAALQELAASSGRVGGLGTAFRPDAAMVFRVPDVRGDSPLKLQHYEEAYGEMARPHPWFFRPIRDWGHPLLDRLGVRWVMGGPDEVAPRPDWRMVYQGPDARIWERPDGLPLARWEGGPASSGARALRVIDRRPGGWTLEVGAGPESRLVVAEIWDPGWRARWNDRALAIEPEGGLLLSVRAPEDGGRLRLAYRPRGILAGALLSLGGLLVMVSGVGRRFVRSPGGGRVTA